MASPRIRAHYRELSDLWLDLVRDFRHPDLAKGWLPADWSDIDGRPVPERDRLTLRVDRDVAKFYRAMGRGYQERMNRVLRGYMLARLAELIEPPDLTPRETVTPEDREALAAEAALMRKLERLRAERLGR